jgi:hypothetical protein
MAMSTAAGVSEILPSALSQNHPDPINSCSNINNWSLDLWILCVHYSLPNYDFVDGTNCLHKLMPNQSEDHPAFLAALNRMLESSYPVYDCDTNFRTCYFFSQLYYVVCTTLHPSTNEFMHPIYDTIMNSDLSLNQRLLGVEQLCQTGDIPWRDTNDKLQELAVEVVDELTAAEKEWSEDSILTIVKTLFTKHGYKGNRKEYYNSENSFPSSLIITKKLGIPLSMSIFYADVWNRAYALHYKRLHKRNPSPEDVKDNSAYVINSPRHVLVTTGPDTVVDPHNDFAVCNLADAIDTFPFGFERAFELVKTLAPEVRDRLLLERTLMNIIHGNSLGFDQLVTYGTVDNPLPTEKLMGSVQSLLIRSRMQICLSIKVLNLLASRGGLGEMDNIRALDQLLEKHEKYLLGNGEEREWYCDREKYMEMQVKEQQQQQAEEEEEEDEDEDEEEQQET